MRDIKNRRAVSPVIATVILVAVAITIAVAVSYWMGGISSQYTRFEKLELTSAYCEVGTTANLWTGAADQTAWNITIDMRNTGTTQATIINAFVNGKAICDFGPYAALLPPAFDLVRAYDVENSVQLDFDEAGVGTTISKGIDPGAKGSLVIEIKKFPDAAQYEFSPGTTIEITITTGAGNSYMKMVTLS